MNRKYPFHALKVGEHFDVPTSGKSMRCGARLSSTRDTAEQEATDVE